MRPPKTTAGPVCLWLPRLLLCVGAYFDFVGASERLSRTGTARRKRTQEAYPNSALHARSRLFMATLTGQSY
jgi:hypothetical protein